MNHQMTTTMTTKRLTKGHDKCLGGVCSGIAEYFELDPTLVRLGYAALSLFSVGFPGLILYIVMACVMPSPQDSITYNK